MYEFSQYFVGLVLLDLQFSVQYFVDRCLSPSSFFFWSLRYLSFILIIPLASFSFPYFRLDKRVCNTLTERGRHKWHLKNIVPFWIGLQKRPPFHMKQTREKIQDLTMKNIIHTDEKELHFVWTQLRIATNNVVFLV